MKKVIPLLSALAIATAPFAAYVQAETPATTTEATETTDAKKTETKSEAALVEVANLTLEDVIKRGVENSTNLLILQYRLEALDQQVLDTDFDIGEVDSNINSLNSRYRSLSDQLKALESQATPDTSAIATLEAARSGIPSSVDALQDQIEALELAIKNLESGKVQLQLQKEEAKAGVTLMLTSSYTSLLLMQDQLKLAEQALTNAKLTVSRTKRLYDLGMSSNDAVRQANSAVRTQQKQVDDLKKKYVYDLAKLCFDIGVIYNPLKGMTLQTLPQYTPTYMEKPLAMEELVNKSYKVKKAEQDVQIAQDKLDDTYREYNDYDSSGLVVSNFQLEQYALLLKAAKATLDLTKEQVKTSLNQLYYQADQAFAAYEEANAVFEDAKKDNMALKKRYELGLVSKYSYDTSLVKLQQAELAASTAKTQYYLVEQQVKAAESGYVQ